MYVPREYDFGRYGRYRKDILPRLEELNLEDDTIHFEEKLKFLRYAGVREILCGNKWVSVGSLSKSPNPYVSRAVRGFNQRVQMYLLNHKERYEKDLSDGTKIGGAFGRQLEFMLNGSCNGPPPGQSVFGNEGTTRGDANRGLRGN